MGDSFFKKGAKVEISSDDEGFRGAWYPGVVLRPPTKKGGKVVVKYETLMSEEDETTPLRETIDLVKIRPVPPREANTRAFEMSEEVDAFHNDGWWEGVVIEVMKDSARYSVYFRATREQLEFERSDLRLHREWVNGVWVPPLEEEGGGGDGEEEEVKEVKEEKVLSTSGGNLKEGTEEELFSKGSLVEVSSDEDGFRGAWFAATVVQALGKDKFLIKYKDLRTEDDTEFLKEEVDALHIRPCPPENVVADKFGLYEEVDALYNDGWWVGVISKVLGWSKYLVYFRETNEEIEFKHDELRLHHEWMDGKWVNASKGPVKMLLAVIAMYL